MWVIQAAILALPAWAGRMASSFSDMLSAEVLLSFSCMPDLYRESF
jgi:hypothetical protein